jgi:hypothetical protein
MARSRIDRTTDRQYPIALRQAIARYLPARGLALLGPDRWTDRLLVLVMLLMAYSGLPTLQERFSEARQAVVAMYASRQRPGKTWAGLSAKLRRHSQRLLALVTAHLRRQMVRRLAGCWRVAGFVAFGVDGTKIDCPRTRANQRRFKIGGKKKSGPQQLLVTLLHLGSGIAWAFRRSHAKASERGLLRQMLGVLPAKALLVADAGFVGYDVMTAILGKGHALLIRAGANTHLLRKLGYDVEEKQGRVYLWPRRAQAAGAPPLVLRLIVLHDRRGRRMCLLTNLSPEALSGAQAAELYRCRWHVELLFRTMKQTLARRKMLCTTPANAAVELDWTVVAQWLLSLLLWETRAEKIPAQRGFAPALRLVRAAMAGRGDRRASLWQRLRAIREDRYVRLRPKAARHWAHKKNDPPCGIPKMRIATPQEIRLAQEVYALKRAA